MKLITGEEAKKVERCMESAFYYALKSACKKSQRGVVIVKHDVIIGHGYNQPRLESLCCLREEIRDNSRVELCSAVHAEQMAILDADNISSLDGSVMYHIKVKDGVMKPSGMPSCTVCSRLILETGIKEVVLWHNVGYVAYTPEEFNLLSYQPLLKK